MSNPLDNFVSDTVLILSALLFGLQVSEPLESPQHAPSMHDVTPELRLPCKVTEVYDGDTLTCEVTIPIKVRLLDCWAPEIRGVDGPEKAKGIAARDYLRELALDENGVLVVPIDGKADSLGDLFSFERLLGEVWVGHPRKNLSEIMVESGYATVEREP